MTRVSYVLRVVLPDRPGSLGAVATELGRVDADILAMEVVERGSGYAVDDIVVGLPSGRQPDALITAAERVAGVSDVDVVASFVRHVRGTEPAGSELAVLTDALASAIRARVEV